MAIEIYDKAATIIKDGTVYYLLKAGSKNCFTCPYQTVIDNNFRDKYLRGEARESDWRVVATGTLEQHERGLIGDTDLNCPTAHVYGRIRFGNKLNIALWFAKSKPQDYYTAFDDYQRANIDSVLRSEPYRVIDLGAIPEALAFTPETTYCGDTFRIGDGKITNYGGRQYWGLDNL